MRPKVVVVEGKNDFSRLKQIDKDMFIITTNGSAILKSSIDALKKLDETHDIILFLDPDYAGTRIRHKLEKMLKHVYHAFIDQEEAYSKNRKKIGIEHASTKTILNSLSKVYRKNENHQSDIDISFLYNQGLIGKPDSKQKRTLLSKKLHIGHVNGKTLLLRLHHFNLTKKDVCEVLICNTNPKKDLDKTF